MSGNSGGNVHTGCKYSLQTVRGKDLFEMIPIYTFTSSWVKLGLALFPTISALLSISISPESVAAHSYIQPLQQIHRCHKFNKAQNFEFITNGLETSKKKKIRHQVLQEYSNCEENSSEKLSDYNYCIVPDKLPALTTWSCDL